ncbi:Glycosyl hydrolases family 2, TIM barrel domain [Tenacibaculum sp. MAR_2009_124]|uniref:glycoside hydrolase family 2 TIM barrel-domain containing protein n=1 Tax=Tenacibaculum sp. MAR_2009_124 TaxID=1250059 RepID=UPI000897FC1B|nr:glycoside hydrolase family 2 TIM barrel-domain containing protein [Tenacibaculum sp. MAR_2009_124]SEB74492.1 Glycosyl hydrolases family 2, TIM barrel domain [Tenacibaculum sp. MAR_2009_124]
MIRHYSILNFFFLSLINIVSVNCQTEVEKHNDGWKLFVNEKEYNIKGVTFGYEDDVENYDTYFKELKFLGVNTIRTWASGNNMKELLDVAHKNGIKVMVGIWMRHGRPGMEDDDSFNYLEDTQGKEEMYNNAIKTVNLFKNHEAVLTWGVGNEVYLNMATGKEKIAYSELLERICSDIKIIDKNHPITSVEAWTYGLDWWSKYVPSIDIYGLNCYGQGAVLLSDELVKKHIDKPYIITEFGVQGEWDVTRKTNGVKNEPSDFRKYNAIAKGYPNWIKNKPNNLGVFVFHYASGSQFIAPWFFTHYNKMKRPQYWAIREAFTGKLPENNIPEIKNFNIKGSSFNSESWISVDLEAIDTDNDSLTVSFSYNQRTGSRVRRDQIKTLIYKGNLKDGFRIKLPKENGAVKIYAMIKDSYDNLAIASTGVEIKDEEVAKRKYLVPKVELPFYVYKNGVSNAYSPSAYMGNYKKMKVDMEHIEKLDSKRICLKLSYHQPYDWFGLGLVNPANDWGNILGGYDISGARKFSFLAKANKKNIKVTVGFGLIGKDKKYPDTAKKSKEVKLTTKWKKYSFSIKKLDLSCIRSGLTIFSSGNGDTVDIFLDDVVFE